MRAACWHGVRRVGIERVPDPTIINPRDAIVRVLATSICGSDLHFYDGVIPSMERGDIMGHELVGEIVELGTDVKTLSIGDRVVVVSTIACGRCYFCQRDEHSLCDNANPNAWAAEKYFGFSPAASFGCSHLFGGYAGAFADYVRVPFADVGAMRVPDELSDESALFLADAVPTGLMGADLCAIRPGDVVAVWGCGAVGQFAIAFARRLGAARVIAIDRYPERLRLAVERSGAIPLDYASVDLLEELQELTGGRGPDACIDAVGMEARGVGASDLLDRAKTFARLSLDRITVLRQMIRACRKGGTVVVMGVYAGYVDDFPMGIALGKALTLRMGMTHGQRYARLAMERVLRGELDPAFVVSHRMPLDDVGEAFETFERKVDGCTRVVLRP